MNETAPFAGRKTTAGYTCTEDLARMGKETGIAAEPDLPARICAAPVPERMHGHRVSGRVMKGGMVPCLHR